MSTAAAEVFQAKPVELRPSDPAEPGIRRRRRGRGFSYTWASGRPVRDRAALLRIRALAIPPAWTDVWICAHPNGHLQAVGTDSAGRRQYRYHDEWRRQQDEAKFDHVLEIAERLPAFRERVARDLRGEGLGRERVLATAARMLDIGFFRVGGEEYTDSYGLATLRTSHVKCGDGRVVCRYLAKGRKEREQVLADAEVCEVLTALSKGHRGELLRYRADESAGEGAGETGEGAWVDVRSADINAYLRDAFGSDVSAKDFRTWHATVLAAVGLAVSRPVRSGAGRKRAVSRVMKEVSEYLGNTPSVCRASYVDPRLVALYEKGRTIPLERLAEDAEGGLATHGPVEQAVIALLRQAPSRRSARRSAQRSARRRRHKDRRAA
ncbi:DNA topoisomerase IB [Microbispora triticiradicis]|uniref:DNA topoisomerase n=2 Tax=Microbispora TaxID=2005 RepID=A0ABY3M0Y3_9ACTN|nr:MULTISPECIES: DNA topoisomerase IB [Microbispora]TLP52858.1 DNA topoisomerase IB [Microbispora fusca]TYB62935.1 DNA topoisomerase IB [Microbispora tritici]